VSDHLFKGDEKNVYRFLEEDKIHNTTLSQKQPSPISLKVASSCSAPPANILPAKHFGWEWGFLNPTLSALLLHPPLSEISPSISELFCVM